METPSSSKQESLLKQVKVSLTNQTPANGSDSGRRSDAAVSVPAFQPAQGKSLLQSAIDHSKSINEQVKNSDVEADQVSRGASVQQMFMKQQQESAKRASVQLISNTVTLPGQATVPQLQSDSFLQAPFQPDGSIFSRQNLFDNQVSSFRGFPVKDLTSNLDWQPQPTINEGLNSIQPIQTTAAGPVTRMKSISRQNSFVTGQQPPLGTLPSLGQGMKHGDSNLNFSMRIQQQREKVIAEQIRRQPPSPCKVLKRRSSKDSANNYSQKGSKRSCGDRDNSQSIDSIAQVRLRQEQLYVNKAIEGKRMRKNKDQMKILLDEFEHNHKWTYEQSVRIGEKIGMTFHQVSKWNWDQRKKRGIPTERIKIPRGALD